MESWPLFEPRPATRTMMRRSCSGGAGVLSGVQVSRASHHAWAAETNRDRWAVGRFSMA